MAKSVVKTELHNTERHEDRDISSAVEDGLPMFRFREMKPHRCVQTAEPFIFALSFFFFFPSFFPHPRFADAVTSTADCLHARYKDIEPIGLFSFFLFYFILFYFFFFGILKIRHVTVS